MHVSTKWNGMNEAKQYGVMRFDNFLLCARKIHRIIDFNCRGSKVLVIVEFRWWVREESLYSSLWSMFRNFSCRKITRTPLVLFPFRPENSYSTCSLPPVPSSSQYFRHLPQDLQDCPLFIPHLSLLPFLAVDPVLPSLPDDCQMFGTFHPHSHTIPSSRPSVTPPVAQGDTPQKNRRVFISSLVDPIHTLLQSCLSCLSFLNPRGSSWLVCFFSIYLFSFDLKSREILPSAGSCPSCPQQPGMIQPSQSQEPKM